jgi:hypothetical protein
MCESVQKMYSQYLLTSGEECTYSKTEGYTSCTVEQKKNPHQAAIGML